MYKNCIIENTRVTNKKRLTLTLFVSKVQIHKIDNNKNSPLKIPNYHKN